MTDIKTYIESGILEKYVLGETNEMETREVMDMSGKYPEIKAEIDKIEESLLFLAQSASVKPKTETKQKLMDELFGEEAPANIREKQSAGKVVEMKAPRRFNLAIAASVALLISVGTNVYLYQQLEKSESAYVALSNERQSLADNQKLIQADYKSVKDQLSAVLSEGMIPVSMKGMNSQPKAKASVYYDTASGDVYLHLVHMEQIPEDKQFQLWAIVDGKPVDAGVFDSKTNTLVMKMKNCPKPSAFAVTIEKNGGSPVPTLEQMVLMGAMSS